MEFNDPGARKRKIKLIAISLLFVAVLASIIYDYFETSPESGSVLGDMETVIVLSPKGPVNVTAKIDTGADYSAIDSSLAQSLGLPRANIRRKVKNAQGIQIRETVSADFVLANQEISTVMSLADRSQLSTEMIIGRNDLQGFTIDPSRKFLNEPKTTIQKPSWSSFLVRASNRALNKQIIIFPILAIVVVVLRLLVGMRTFGVFAPVVIALSLILMEPDIWQGIITYIALISVGVAIKLLIFSRMQLPSVVESALIMMALLLTLVVFALLPLDFQMVVTTVLFPLIITSHIVERFSRAIEDQRLLAAFPLLVETFLVALILTYLGIFLENLPIELIWKIFAISVLVAIAAGNYMGLRLREFFRFDKLKQK